MQENETIVSSLLTVVDFSRAGPRYQCRKPQEPPPQPPPHSDATTIMVAILVVVVMIASVLTDMHAYISARGDVASKFEIIAKT